ncbi:hypothetical protein [Rhizobium sp. C4]|uniref:hypothetical protein n=1 Tax=Rhizobium sp. C4 TaxID=1349800 RepID=UPI001E536004|nr:hypothetical protein [Rhizobium sp. C4]MCD2173043.1 hypothetical protein [Rhizobium sp. C4]
MTDAFPPASKDHNDEQRSPSLAATPALDPSHLSAVAPDFKLRAALFMLSLMTVMFPLVTVRGFYSQGISLPLLAGGVAYLLPAVAAAALAAPFVQQMRPLIRVIDMGAACVNVLFLLWGLLSLVDGYRSLAAFGGQFGLHDILFSGILSPSIGAFTFAAMILLTLWNVRDAFKQR